MFRARFLPLLQPAASEIFPAIHPALNSSRTIVSRFRCRNVRYSTLPDSTKDATTSTSSHVPSTTAFKFKNELIRDVLLPQRMGDRVTVRGWVRSTRRQTHLSFIILTDGSNFNGIQAIMEGDAEPDVTTGACLELTGKLVDSPAPEQDLELSIEQVKVLNACDRDYPIQKKRHSFEFLRVLPHIRSRTNSFGAMWRTRNAAMSGIQKFMQETGCLQVHTPVITTLDCEGGGEVFRVISDKNVREVLSNHSTKPTTTTTDGSSTEEEMAQEYFRQPTYLTVSGQLHLECITQAVSRAYTLGPAFRAEESLSTRHLAEFWMLEAEFSFLNGLSELLDFTEAMIRRVTETIVESCPEDVKFFGARIDKDLDRRLRGLLEKGGKKLGFGRMTYTEAVRALLNPANTTPVFENPVKWGLPLSSEHEKWLAGTYVDGPLFVTDFPKSIKPFYMRVNDHEQTCSTTPEPTVACFDLLVPGIGELAGGSMREERAEHLRREMEAAGILKNEDYKWYLDLRRFGGAPTGGFGMGFERYLQFVTGMASVRDCVPMPRYSGKCVL